MDPVETRRRIKAARTLAGIQSADELAERMEVGHRTVRKMESGERAVRPMELREIARVCGLPYEFFTADFTTLASPLRSDTGSASADDAQAVLRRLEAKVDEALALLADVQDALPTPEEQLEELEAEADARNGESGAGREGANPGRASRAVSRR